MTVLDTLTQKLKETHEEIHQVQTEVIGALRSFYASSSTISIDEAVEIAAKWGASPAFPIDDDDVNATDLQEKMRRLNVALLDAVDRLQLDEGGEMASEAKLMLSLLQREQLTQQVQQSKTMLAIIEQLTEMDRLLSDMDEAMDRQDFVTAAEGVAEAERLVQELVKEEMQDGGDMKEEKIVQVVNFQLQSKKNRLLHELSRYFACTFVWKEKAVKVTMECVSEEGEQTENAKEHRRTAFWKACEVLDILTPRLRDVAKAVAQYLITPLLRSPRGTLKQIRHDGGVTLQIGHLDDDAPIDSKMPAIQSQYTHVVDVLRFVHAEVFAGDTELMNQFGDFLWKIPGNLERQLLNQLQNEIPQDFAALNAYREHVLTAITGLEDGLMAIGFLSCSTSQLRQCLDQLHQLHSKKRRQVILSKGCDLIRQSYHDSVKINGKLEKCSVQAPNGTEKKGKGKGLTGSSVSCASSSNDEVESSCFQVPDYRVTVCAHELVELVHQTLLEACTSSALTANLFFQTARDLFLLYRGIVSTLYKEEIANDSRTCMLYHNDCLYMAYHMVVLGHLYKHRFPMPLKQTATMVDLLPSFKDAGEQALTSYTSAQAEEILSGLKSLPSLGAIDSEYDSKRVESFLDRTLYKLNTMSTSWREGLPQAVYNRVMSRMLEPLVKKVVTDVMAQANISANNGAYLHHLLSLLKESESLFVSPAQAVKYAPSLERLAKLTSMLMDPLTTVRDKFISSSLDVFSSKELAVLVRSLFRDSPERSAFLKELSAARDHNK